MGSAWFGGPVATVLFVSLLSLKLAAGLVGAEHFTLITEVLPIPSGALGMEALREVAARYRLRYLLRYREELSRSVSANAWAAGYATILGALFLPGETLRIDGLVEASLFDVKTGVLLFTVRRRVDATQTANVWQHDEKLGRLSTRLTAAAMTDLARDVRRAVREYVASVRVENARRMPLMPPSSTPTAAPLLTVAAATPTESAPAAE